MGGGSKIMATTRFLSLGLMVTLVLSMCFTIFSSPSLFASPPGSLEKGSIERLLKIPVHVKECSTLSESGRVYQLVNDLEFDGIGNCIVITGSGITFDGGNHLISGINGPNVGIYSEASGITVKRVKVSMAPSNDSYGIYLKNSNGSKIMDSVFTRQGKGIYLFSSPFTTIENVESSYNSREGAYDFSSSNTKVSRSKFLYNGGTGFEFNQADRNVVTYSVANGNGDGSDHGTDAGFRVSGGSFNVFDHNEASNNPSQGHYFTSGGNNSVTNSVINNNTRNAIRFSASHGNLVQGNTFSDNTKGMRLSLSNNNIIKDIYISGTKEYAFWITPGGSNNLLQDITFDRTLAEGLYMDGSSLNNKFVDVKFINRVNPGTDINFSSGLNGNQFTDFVAEAYSFGSSGSKLIFENTENGKVSFLSPASGKGINLNEDIVIKKNSIAINPLNLNDGLDKPAEVTFYNMEGSVIKGILITPVILRNGVACGVLCNNLTSLSVDRVIITVPGEGVYSIGSAKK